MAGMPLKVNVAHWSSKLPNKVSIARSQPPGMNLPGCSRLKPSVKLLREIKNGHISWEQYVRIFWAEFIENTNALYHPDISVEDRLIELIKYYFDYHKKQFDYDLSEITLCCWEGAADEHCHRKLIYDRLPVEWRGERK